MVTIKTPEQIETMRRGGKILASILRQVTECIEPGISTTKDLDQVSRQLCDFYGVKPAFLDYHGYPGSLCTSVNEKVVHGIPDGTVLQSGDIISLDFGVELEGLFTDSAITVGVGEVSEKVQKLMDVTKESLAIGLKRVKPGNRLGDVGSAIQKYCEHHGFGVVRDLVGHGVGLKLHEDPAVPNYGRSGQGLLLREGMTIAIEPMINIGTWRVRTLSDGWTVVTEDGLPSAHYEHTVAVTADGVDILTLEE